MKLYIVRHAESQANVENRLAGNCDVPLSTQGIEDAKALACAFLDQEKIDIAFCSPLIRAIQTCCPFVSGNSVPMYIDPRLIEQDIGVFSGKTYLEAESDQHYQKDRSKRWDWVPQDGESYKMIASRVSSFLDSLKNENKNILIVTHAVTMRLFRAVLECTVPEYPLDIAKNGEIWEIDFQKNGDFNQITPLFFGDKVLRSNRA